MTGVVRPIEMRGIMRSYQDMRLEQTQAMEKLLRLMIQRRAAEEKDDCAITFREDSPDDADVPALKEARVLNLVDAVCGNGSDGVPGENWTFSAQDNRGDDSDDRFVQFAFMQSSFYLDLPDTTLSLVEARHLIDRRHGFFYLRDRRWPWMSYSRWHKLIKDFNPLQKEYLNSDVHAAAEDTITGPSAITSRYFCEAKNRIDANTCTDHRTAA